MLDGKLTHKGFICRRKQYRRELIFIIIAGAKPSNLAYERHYSTRLGPRYNVILSLSLCFTYQHH
jgi:hypothetical protein